jgi:hypothetical protein
MDCRENDVSGNSSIVVCIRWRGNVFTELFVTHTNRESKLTEKLLETGFSIWLNRSYTEDNPLLRSMVSSQLQYAET